MCATYFHIVAAFEEVQGTAMVVLRLFLTVLVKRCLYDGNATCFASCGCCVYDLFSQCRHVLIEARGGNGWYTTCSHSVDSCGEAKETTTVVS